MDSLKNLKGELELTAEIILEAMVDGIFVINQDGAIIQENSTFARMYGYATLIGRHITEISIREYISSIYSIMEKLFRRGELVFEFEFIGVRANGERFPCRMNASILGDEKGGIKGLLGVVRDITEIVKAQEEARNAALMKRAQDVMDAMVDGVAVVNLDGIIVQENRALAEAHGYKSVVGKNVNELIIPGDREKAEEAIKKAIFTGDDAIGIELNAMTAGGRSFPVTISQTTMRNEKGEIEGFTAVIRDITELKGAHKEAIRAAALIAEAEAERRNVNGLRALNDQLRENEQELKASNEHLRVKEQALKSSQEEFKKKVSDLEKLNRLMVGRELRMVELKERIKELEEQLRGE